METSRTSSRRDPILRQIYVFVTSHERNRILNNGETQKSLIDEIYNLKFNYKMN